MPVLCPTTRLPGTVQRQSSGHGGAIVAATIKVVTSESSIALTAVSQPATDTRGGSGRNGASAVALEYAGFLGGVGTFYSVPTFIKRGVNGVANPAVNFQGYLYNGGLVSLPISKDPCVQPTSDLSCQQKTSSLFLHF